MYRPVFASQCHLVGKDVIILPGYLSHVILNLTAKLVIQGEKPSYGVWRREKVLWEVCNKPFIILGLTFQYGTGS